MAVTRGAVLACGFVLAFAGGRLSAESGFRLQRLMPSDDSASYADALDEKKNQPVHKVNFNLPIGAVLAMSAGQALQLDIEPLETWGAVLPKRRAVIDGFAEKTLVPFLRLMRKPRGAVTVGERVANEAERVFPGTGAAFAELARASSDPEENEPRIRGAVSRINAVFHREGLHLTFGRFMEFDGGTVELNATAVAERLMAQINDRTVPVYVLTPFDPAFRVPALGMMEPYPPRIFILGDMIALQTQDINVFLRADKDYPFEDPNVPVASIPDAVQTKINQIVRQKLRDGVGTDRQAVERWLVRSVARHEGQHLVMDRTIKEAVEAHKIEWEDFNRFHERQAYLFELETSDPAFTPFVLLASFAISAAVSDKYSRVGCGAALRGLQKQIPEIRFWENDFNRPIPGGLIPLFEMPAEKIRAAAGRARVEVEKFLISSSRSSEQ